ncbi:hypothetical protein FA15DRAFT_661700 [Coprinopsis marcescibilis]|uniref:Uncharacterized protein n=1 Tax=Coprinopsis marcescibilis TaxID=230819 RepID=A0A5C3KAG7_COPMA|nr:hypothetical protein FA15DRAFT_661700 [Coprinopsis marcescibilis]
MRTNLQPSRKLAESASAGVLGDCHGVYSPAAIVQAPSATSVSRAIVRPGHQPDGQEASHKQIRALKAAEQCLKKKLDCKEEEIKDLKAEIQTAKREYEEMEGKVDRADERFESLQKENEQYWRWWLNKIQFTKLLLSMDHDSNPRHSREIAQEIQRHYLN